MIRNFTLSAFLIIFATTSLFAQTPHIAGEWELVSHNFTKFNGEMIEGSQITLSIDTEKGRVSGYSGCNRYFGSVKIEDTSILSFGAMASTKRACYGPAQKLETLFHTTLSGADSFSIENADLLIGNSKTNDSLRFKKVVEPEVLSLIVNTTPIDCVGVARTKCIRIKENAAAEWQILFEPIEGFAFTKDTFYVIEVEKIKILNPPADAADFKLKLRKVIQESQDEPIATE